MGDFTTVIALAAKRRGGMDGLESALAETRSRTPAEIAATPDDRILAEMTRRIFNAGFARDNVKDVVFQRYFPRDVF